MKLKNNSNSEFSDPGLCVVNYFYKTKKQKSKNRSSGYSIQPHEKFDAALENQFNSIFPERLLLYPNQIDSSKTYIVIKFYLPKPAKAKLILMDSDKTDAIYFINNKLKAGHHTFVTAIRNVELLKFCYYYKLETDGYSEVRQMRYIRIC